jgi:hypothetical protein
MANPEKDRSNVYDKLQALFSNPVLSQRLSAFLLGAQEANKLGEDRSSNDASSARPESGETRNTKTKASNPNSSVK